MNANTHRWVRDDRRRDGVESQSRFRHAPRLLAFGHWRRALACCAVPFLMLTPSHAFPPAPYHTLHGMVRNELGEPLDVSSAKVYLATSSGTTAIAADVGARLSPGDNYALQVPMDADIAPDNYQSTALRPFLPFKLKVRIGNVSYLPIEMKGDYATLGRPGEATRIDLTLGEDSDGDGLPDAWERTLITASGGKLTLADIKPGGDYDGDGISNLDEYLAGTYAFNPADGFVLKMIGANADSSLFEFLAIRGRTYSIQASADFSHWAPVEFRLGGGGAGAALVQSYLATDVRNLRVEVPNSDEAGEFRYFKVLVQ
jgi:hypothetical protein